MTRKTFLIGVILFQITSGVVAQDFGDSGIQSYKNGNYDSAVYYLDSAILQTDFDQAEQLFSLYSYLGASYLRLGRNQEAIAPYRSALRYAESTGNKNWLALAHYNLGLAFKDANYFQSAIQELTEAAKQYQVLHQGKRVIQCWKALANTYRQLKQFDLAYEYLSRVEDWALNELDSSRLATVYNDLAIWYFDQGQLDSALANLTLARTLKEAIPNYNRVSLARTYSKLGEVYLGLDSLEASQYFIEQSKAIRRGLNDARGLAINYHTLAELSIEKQEISRASAYLDSAAMFLAGTGVQDEIIRNLELLVQVGMAQSQWQAVSRWQSQIIQKRDSLLNEALAVSIADAEVQYEVYQKDQAILLANTRLQRSYLLAILIGLIALAGFVWVRQARINRKRVERLNQEMHHRIKNNLQAMTGLIGLQMQRVQDEAAIETIQKIEGQIQAVGSLHQNLYEQANKPTGYIDLANYLNQLLDQTLVAQGYSRKSMRVECELLPIDWDVQEAMYLGLLVNEMLINAFKHGLSKATSPQLILTTRLEWNELLIEVSDNGPAWEQNQTNHGFGLKMMHQLAKQLKGRFELVWQDTTDALLWLPLKEKSR